MRILLAFNGSRLSEAALHAVITQRRPGNSEVKVLKVIPLDVAEEEVRQAQASLDLAGQALRTAGFKAESAVLKDMVIESIVGAAEEFRAPTERCVRFKQWVCEKSLATAVVVRDCAFISSE
jgi:hypothetical protein